ncbi:hypothetical protein H2198_005572 [Neophaeococcomyces mojaviensis]|uniref:Uncharacterized protein n=1 Tax=Neophaeococcomyces mojaviensis TaxID=3383035 RepID=A0ACC3A5B6_9EURO|nr:hypothetical protein H2198_005572 [Knufia sp. JES_112]
MANWCDLPLEVKEKIIIAFLHQKTICLQLDEKFSNPLSNLLLVSKNFLSPVELATAIFLPETAVTFRAMLPHNLRDLVLTAGSTKIASIKVLKLGTLSERGTKDFTNLQVNTEILSAMPKLQKLHLLVGHAPIILINPCGCDKSERPWGFYRGFCSCPPLEGLEKAHLRARIPATVWQDYLTNFAQLPYVFKSSPDRTWTTDVIKAALKRTPVLEVQLDFMQVFRNRTNEMEESKIMSMSTKDWIIRTAHGEHEIKFPQLAARQDFLGEDAECEAQKLLAEMISAYNAYAPGEGCKYKADVDGPLFT